MQTRAHARSRGFTLLEVMVAIAILGLTLTVILSAQGGLAASNKRAANMGRATNLGRCKMSEVEEKMMKLGYPEVDDLQSGIACCDDKEEPGFSCDTRVEKVVLPNPPDNSLDGGAPLGLSPAGSAGAPGGPGGLGGIASALGASGGLNFDGGLQSLGSAVQDQMGAGGAGAAGMLSMVMGMVYPSLKPMMEASIRRITITVHWKEGPNERDLSLVQYITNPQRGGFAAGVAPVGSAGTGGTGGTGGSGGSGGGGGFPGGGSPMGGAPSPFGGGR